jgi:hypothetical protein
MSRDFHIAGPSMISVRGGAHWSGGYIVGPTELGMTTESVRVEFVRHHKDVRASDYGERAPADVSWQLGECKVKMTLIHFDPVVLRCCLSDSMAGGGQRFSNSFSVGNAIEAVQNDVRPGLHLRTAGAVLGNGLPRLASGNYYVGVTITPGRQLNTNRYRFLHCYLAEQPAVYPIGTEATAVDLTWRAVAYQPLWRSGSDPEEKYVINTNNGPQGASAYLLDQRREIPLLFANDEFFGSGTRWIGIVHTLYPEPLSSGAALWDEGDDSYGSYDPFDFM